MCAREELRGRRRAQRGGRIENNRRERDLCGRNDNKRNNTETQKTRTTKQNNTPSSKQTKYILEATVSVYSFPERV
jgi:hypothetical protein